jgi:hypothetical protein
MEIILKSGMIKPLQQNLALLLDIRSQHHRRGNDLCWETNAEHSRRCSAGGRQGHGESFPATRTLDGESPLDGSPSQSVDRFDASEEAPCNHGKR